MQTIAGIVVFHPEPRHLVELVRTIAADVRAILIFANSPIEPSLAAELSGCAGPTAVSIISEGANVGLAVAYNRLVEAALEREADYLLLFDQDSMPKAGLVRQLEAAAATLTAAGRRPAVVGPRPVGEDLAPFKQPRQRAAALAPELVPLDFVISSGSLLVLGAVKRVGPFREDFFIDGIDIEWCLRAWHLGCSVWMDRDAVMTHRLGRGVIRLPFGWRMVNQPPHRLYTYLRNQLALLRLAHVPLRHKAWTVVSLAPRCLVYLVCGRFSRATAAAIAAGIGSGMRNRLGPPHQAWDRIARLQESAK